VTVQVRSMAGGVTLCDSLGHSDEARPLISTLWSMSWQLSYGDAAARGPPRPAERSVMSAVRIVLVAGAVACMMAWNRENMLD
jgi:hypothetical protein